jgi:hypothetical protein
VIVRVGPVPEPEQLALASLLVEIGRLARPGRRRGLLAAVEDAYGAAVPARRARVLRALLAEAEAAEAAPGSPFTPAELAVFGPVARAR